MNDTSPEAREMMSALMMRRSGEERFIMGALMFDAARELVIASLPPDLSPSELKRRLFERVYGFPLPSAIAHQASERTSPMTNKLTNKQER